MKMRRRSRLRRSNESHCRAGSSGANRRQNSASPETSSTQASMISLVRKGWRVKLGSLIVSGSMGPPPLRLSSNCKNGVTKSATTPSISRPTNMLAIQSKQIPRGRQTRFIVSRGGNMLQKLFGSPRTRLGAGDGTTTVRASGPAKNRRDRQQPGGHRQHHRRRRGGGEVSRRRVRESWHESRG